jgi:hypothetical protein
LENLKLTIVIITWGGPASPRTSNDKNSPAESIIVATVEHQLMFIHIVWLTLYYHPDHKHPSFTVLSPENIISINHFLLGHVSSKWSNIL